MKQIYVISLFFLPLCIYSQLYIKPYGNQESFLYVEGDLLYVERSIDLKKNPEGPYEASIYLRNKGQLIQGNENAQNTGNGMLSVFQEGKATAYTYNYWAAPVQSAFGNSRFGDIFYEPLTRTNSRPAIITTGYNGKANPLTISSRWIFRLSGWGYSDWQFIGNNFNLKPGEGFTMKGVDGVNNLVKLYGVVNNPGGEQRYDFRGIPNTGTIELEIIKDEILLVGNPYPSALDLNQFLQENINTTGIAYFWDSRNVDSHYLQDYEGGYGTYSPALGRHGYVPPVFQKYDNYGEVSGNSGIRGNYYARRYSPIGQGFIIEGLNTGKIYFRNRYREFQKENPEVSEFKALKKDREEEEIPLIRIDVEFKDKYIRQLILAFHPKATNGVDRAMDAKNFSPLDWDAGIWNENENYVIDVRPEPTRVPLEINTTGPTQISFSRALNTNYHEDVFLWDSEENLYYNLKNYQVTIPVQGGNLRGKFWITFETGENKDGEKADDTNEYRIIQNNTYHRAEILAPFTTSTQIIGIYDTSGRKIKEIKGAANEFYYEIPTGNFTKGIYIVKIISGDGTIVSKKVIISNL